MHSNLLKAEKHYGYLSVKSQALATTRIVDIPVLKHQIPVHESVRDFGVHGLA